MKKNRKLILTFVLPITIILFGTITKWHYVYIEDGPSDFIYGFPLPFICGGWFTSFSLQIFVTELVFDFFIYSIICFTVILLTDNYLKPIKVKKYLKFGLYGLAILTILFYGIILFSNPNILFKIKRNFNYKETQSGYQFMWQQKNKE
ncbi:hypothetical protein IW15_17945 [Chryseobacterium soli]|uniref:Uncharacterized protein n=1 Tax=Chryseobacterium soli TaxID=445961 RepID=A0A086A2Y1_9FLAO|nr:hypothetical protein IW15_17945 [Chryseobacterium soli]